MSQSNVGTGGLRVRGCLPYNNGNNPITGEIIVSYNEDEDFMDSERKKIDKSLLSRKGAIYVCCGIENAQDLIDDIKQALDKVIC